MKLTLITLALAAVGAAAPTPTKQDMSTLAIDLLFSTPYVGPIEWEQNTPTDTDDVHASPPNPTTQNPPRSTGGQGDMDDVLFKKINPHFNDTEVVDYLHHHRGDNEERDLSAFRAALDDWRKSEHVKRGLPDCEICPERKQWDAICEYMRYKEWVEPTEPCFP
ncbi:MAG: hypothetical protein M1820_002152 [Bogoriella megaspora]|nr:MAG: hypothetical protein M1820_002152 [Bogoriella megaspora]